jgi:hypothetical protein
MDLAGLLNSVLFGATNIDNGRKNLATDGFEHAGRLFYEYGISIALDTFKNTQASADPQTMILVELTFLQQELQFCDDADTITRGSLTKAIQSFEDTLRCLKIIENSTLYRGAEATYPTATEYRYHGFPRDAIHLACTAHRTRLQNSLRTPGINMIEKTVLTQRLANLKVIQTAYAEKQRKVLTKGEGKKSPIS